MSSLPPVISATGTSFVLVNGWVRWSDLIRISNPDGGAISSYSVTDNNSASNSARIWSSSTSYINQGAGFSILAPKSADDLWIQGGSAPGVNTFYFLVVDADGISNDVAINLVTRTSNTAPVVTANSSAGVPVGQSISAANLINVTDADGDAPVTYRFYDAAGGGSFKLNGVIQGAGQNIDVSAADIGNLTYVGGGAKGSETLYAQVYDGQAWSAWTSWTQQTIRTTNTVSVVSAPTRNTSQATWIKAADLGISITDADGDTPVTYEITDANNGTNSAKFWLGGVYQQGGTMTLTAEQWAGFWMLGGADTSTDALTIRVNDGYGWSNTASFNLVTRLPNRAPVVAGASVGVAIGQSATAASLINVTDADGDTMTAYRFWDSAGGGYFKLGSTVQASGQNLEFTAAQLANLTYVGGSAKGSETLYAQVFDGEAWSAWGSWTQNTIRTTNTLSVVSAPTRNTSQATWIKAADLGISITDAAVSYTHLTLPTILRV